MFADGTLAVRISLDYYRILGVPIQAAAEQLEQARRDRLAQRPRHEYSDTAIAARNSLVDEAYAVLSHPEQRIAYDRSLLAKTYDPEIAGISRSSAISGAAHDPGDGDSNTPSIEIHTDRLIGALLILLELGEYEQVLNLGQYRLGNVTARLRSKYLGDTTSGIPDTALSVALACLELGRERWQQQQYESAAASLEIGQTLLQRESLFPRIQTDIQTELYNLRPYRVLELLAMPEENDTERCRGLQLLKDMLQQRGGIDGDGDDQSGLSMDDFLRFIQQLRSYLTATEQQILFEAEARRPSAVASYLAVYALIAKGFAQCQPALIRRAKVILHRLAIRQDVNLEMAICTMLLGQTEEAIQSLELSQDAASLSFIQEHSQGSPDLLPGLCLYSECWLQEEVFPHFRDLLGQQVSLKDYFANEQVQAYLEELPGDGEPMSPFSSLEPTYTYALSGGYAPHALSEATPFNSPVHSNNATSSAPSPRSPSRSLPSESTDGLQLTPTYNPGLSAPSPLKEATPDNSTTSLQPDLTPIEPPSDFFAAISDSPDDRNAQLEPDQPSQHYGSNGSHPYVVSTTASAAVDATTPLVDPPQYHSDLPSDGGRSFNPTVYPPMSRNRRSPRWDRLLVLLLGGALGGLLIWFLATRAWKPAVQVAAPDRPASPTQTQASSTNQSPGTNPSTSPEATASPNASPSIAADTLTKESAQVLVASWLATKADAMGSNHNIDALEKILTEPVLSQWRAQAEDAQSNNVHGQYTHKVNIVDVASKKPDQVTIEADVQESVQYFQDGQADEGSSYNQTLRVQYTVVRQDEQWRIQTISVLN